VGIEGAVHSRKPAVSLKRGKIESPLVENGEFCVTAGSGTGIGGILVQRVKGTC